MHKSLSYEVRFISKLINEGVGEKPSTNIYVEKYYPTGKYVENSYFKDKKWIPQ